LPLGLPLILVEVIKIPDLQLGSDTLRNSLIP